MVEVAAFLVIVVILLAIWPLVLGIGLIGLILAILAGLGVAAYDIGGQNGAWIYGLLMAVGFAWLLERYNN